MTHQAAEQRQQELRGDADDLAGRHAELRRRFRMLYNGYRALRYKVGAAGMLTVALPPARCASQNVFTCVLQAARESMLSPHLHARQAYSHGRALRG